MSTQKNEQYHILSPEWLRTNPLPEDGFYSFEGSPWTLSSHRGKLAPRGTNKRYATQRTDLPPEAYATPPTDTTGSGREGETLWHLGPAKGGPNTWQDSDSILIAVETSKGWEFALVGISADDGIASMEDYLGEFYGDYSFEDIAYWIHERDIIKLLPLRAAIDSAQRQEGA